MHSKSIKSFQVVANRRDKTMNKTCVYCARLFSAILSALFVPIVCVILLQALQIQSANAHSLVDNSNHGESHHANSVSNNNNNRQHQSNKLMQVSSSMGHNGNQNRCQSGWMWFNNKCWVTTQSRRDFAHAMELCKKMHNSTLPTIHSEDENEFLRQNIDLHNSPIWLYARHNHQYNRTRWLDKSPVNYTRWDVGQPSDKSSLICIKTEESWYMKKAEPVDGQTECVSFWEDAKWGTQVGCLVLLPVVCEKQLPPIKRYQEGQDGTVQSELQQMYPVSSANHVIEYSMTLILAVVLSLNVISQHISYNMLAACSQHIITN